MAYLGARLGNGTQVVDHVGLSHTDTSIDNGEDLVLLVGDDTDVQVLVRVEDGGVRQGRVTDFVESIGTIGDNFTKEDLLVAVESVCMRSVSYVFHVRHSSHLRTDDQVQQLADLGLESKAFSGHFD